MLTTTRLPFLALAALSAGSVGVDALSLASLRSLIQPRAATSKTVDIPLTVDWFNCLEYYGSFCFYVNGSFGTPPQDTKLILNLANGDTVIGAANFFCNESRTCVDNIGSFNQSEGSGEYYSGAFVTDTLIIAPEINLPNFEFAVTPPDEGYGSALSLGSPKDEGAADGIGYADFTSTLVNNGLINLYAYSVFAAPFNGTTGHLIMGGINPDQYVGKLETFDMKITSYSPAIGIQPTIYLESVTITSGSNIATVKNTTILEIFPGNFASYTAFHADTVYQIWDLVGATYDAEQEVDVAVATVPCDWLKNTSTLDFALSPTLKLSVPISQLLNVTSESQIVGFSNCDFQIYGVNDTIPNNIGQNLWQGLYTVYDYTNNEISLAVNSYQTNATSVVEIPTGGVRSLSLPTNTDPASTNGTPTPTPTPTPIPAPSSNKTGLAAGLGVGVPVALATIGALIFFFLRRRRRNSEAYTTNGTVDPKKPETAMVGNQTENQPIYGELPGDGSAVVAPNRRSELPAEQGRNEVYNPHIAGIGESGYGGQNGNAQNYYVQPNQHPSPQSGYEAGFQSPQSGFTHSPPNDYSHPNPVPASGTMGGHGQYADGFPGNDLGAMPGHYGSGGYSGGEYTGQHLEPMAGTEHPISPVSSSARSPGLVYHELPAADSDENKARHSYQPIERRPVSP